MSEGLSSYHRQYGIEWQGFIDPSSRPRSWSIWGDRNGGISREVAPNGERLKGIRMVADSTKYAKASTLGSNWGEWIVGTHGSMLITRRIKRRILHLRLPHVCWLSHFAVLRDFNLSAISWFDESTPRITTVEEFLAWLLICGLGHHVKQATRYRDGPGLLINGREWYLVYSNEGTSG